MSDRSNLPGYVASVHIRITVLINTVIKYLFGKLNNKFIYSIMRLEPLFEDNPVNPIPANTL